MARSRSTTRSPGVKVGQGKGGISLPIAQQPASVPTGIKPSRMSRRRAWVLGIVQLLLIAHITQWLITGHTTTPIEPSESMEFASDGIVNAGLIFFGLALLSTLIFGRWMCGWMCHLVLLQDLCGWIMKKCGIRPKPFRSRLLIYVPLALALYMFIWPMVFRWGVLPLDTRLGMNLGADNWFVQAYREVFAFGGVQLPRGHVSGWEMRLDLTTDDFWHTFPGIGLGVLTLLICGFGCVYLLGAKGFCTYGCPYGGFFAPLDTLAVGRIRVNDDCEQCGHCTAVCTSNVRVSEEVNAYGMVVDPGCMKCMDCVSVCPNDALSFGFGPPAVLKPKVQSTPTRTYDMSWLHEIVFAAVFIACFYGSRGVYGPGVLPLLMAIGIAGCSTFVFFKAWQTLRKANVRLHTFQLRRDGNTSRSGWLFRVITLGLGLLCIHSVVVHGAKTMAAYHDSHVRVLPGRVFSEHPARLDPAMDASAASALGWYAFASSLGEGGIGLLATDQDSIDLRSAWLYATRLDFERADAVLLRAIERDGPQPSLCVSRLRVLIAQQRHDELVQWAGALLVTHEQLHALLDGLVQWADSQGREPEVISICQRRLDVFADHLHTMRWLSLLLLEVGRTDEGIALIEQTIVIDPTSAGAYETLARAYASQGNTEQAEQTLRDGVASVDDELTENLHRMLGQLLHQRGATAEAQRHLDRATQLRLDREQPGSSR